VKVRFFQWQGVEFQHSAGGGPDVLLSNFTTAGMGATGIFADSIRVAEWGEVSFGADNHGFNLSGSAKALDAIKVYFAQIARHQMAELSFDSDWTCPSLAPLHELI